MFGKWVNDFLQGIGGSRECSSGGDGNDTCGTDNGGAFIGDNNVNRGGGGGKDTTSLTGLLLPTLPTPEQIKHQMFLASQHLNVQEWENYLRESTARSDLTGMFDWARSDLTGKFDWARSDLTGLSKWERYMRDTTTTLRHSFDRQVVMVLLFAHKYSTPHTSKFPHFLPPLFRLNLHHPALFLPPTPYSYLTFYQCYPALPYSLFLLSLL